MYTIDVDGDAMPGLGLGTWKLEGAECRDTVATALAMGYRHIDTATMYQNEADIGAGIATAGVPREELWITTKVWRDDLHHDEVLESIRTSCRRLGTAYVDLALVHWPNDDVPLAETMAAFTTAREAGMVRHLGVSNFTPSQVAEAADLARVVCNQIECHPFLQQHPMHRELRDRDMVLTAYSPLARGRVAEDLALQDLAAAHGLTPAQLAIAWQLQRPGVAVIPKASGREHLRSNLDATEVDLRPDELDAVASLDRGERIIDPDFAPAWGR